VTQEDELMHYGILRRSGRYPWGSGKDEYTRSRTFQKMVNDLNKQGIADKDIAVALGLDPKVFTLTALRDTRTIAKEEVIRYEKEQAAALRAKGMSVKAIAEKMGIPESTVNLRIKDAQKREKESLKSVADAIRADVDKHQITDIGKGNNIQLDISPERYRAAISILKDEGYNTYTLPVKLPGSKNFTNQKVIVPPGVTYGEARKMTDKIHSMVSWSEDNGRTIMNIHPPMSVDSKRLAVEYSSDKDGVVYVRPGAEGLDMGKNRYAQVRISIDGTHFIKGMAVLSDDIPAGKDMLFHTNKTEKTPLLGKDNSNSILKKLKDDPDNPFGATIKRQIVDIDPKTGKERLKSAINLVNEEGDWDTWSNSLASQMLSKQPQSLIKSQLAETVKMQKAKIDEINSITSPVLRRKQLEKLADQIDSDAVDLRAAAMPGQKTQVIIPVPKLNPNEVYAPQFATGDRVVLIRYPHGGKFEIPEVTVNNNNRAAKKLLGNAPDAIGIHPKVAQKLSGADFDGDTVVVIPNPKGLIRGSTTLGKAAYQYEKGLNGFNPKEKYGNFEQAKNPDGSPKVDKKGNPVGNFKLMKNTGMEMGMITNLITDMSIQGASPEHIVRAVRHSMVVIDAEKHQLDYKRSEIDNGIRALKKQYQGSEKSGASTLLSKATATVQVPQRKLRGAKEGGPIDPKTGEKVYVETGRTRNKFDKKTNTYLDEKVLVTEPVARLALTNNARTLTSKNPHPVELLYADHANEMKALANKTRLQASKIATPKQNPAAKKEYKAELDDLVYQLRQAQKQKPLDRQATIIANAAIKQKMQEDPTLRYDRDRRLKVERQTRDGVRAKMGLKKNTITISDRAWDAIQAGAVSSNIFKQILDGNYVKEERLFELAIPKKNPVMTAPLQARAKAMLSAGMTNADIARVLGVPASTIRDAVVRGDI
jgi:transcriptional regulator with XRE-family HTH domain